MRGKALFVAAGVLLASGQAHADLIGTNVDALFLGPTVSAAEDLNQGATITVGPGIEYPASNTAAAQDAGVTIDITGTQIIIANFLINTPFCFNPGATGCADAFVGFKFIFSNFASGVHITGATVDAASAADFRPVAPLTSDTSTVQVDVENDVPVQGDQLILDIALSSPTSGGGGTVPEPASLFMLASGLLALSGFAARQRQSTRA